MRLVFDVQNDSPEPDELTSPHFDDETTVLSARPVVPLGHGNSALRTKGVFVLLATALVSGFIGGLIFIRYERARGEARATGQNAPTTTFTVPPEATTPDQNTDSTVPDAVETAKAESGTSGPQVTRHTPEENDSVQGTRRNLGQKRALDREFSTDPAKQQENDRVEQLRQDSLRESGRPQRQAEGTRARRATARPDDIFRIGDIFEGSRRP